MISTRERGEGERERERERERENRATRSQVNRSVPLVPLQPLTAQIFHSNDHVGFGDFQEDLRSLH